MKRFVRSLSQEEREKLLKAIEGGKDTQVYRKAMAILLSWEGRSVKEIAEELGLTKQAVLYIFRQFENNGIDLFLSKRRGRKEKFTDEDIQKIAFLVNEFTPSDFGFKKNRWTLSTISKGMEKIYNLKIAPSTVRYILSRISKNSG